MRNDARVSSQQKRPTGRFFIALATCVRSLRPWPSEECGVGVVAASPPPLAFARAADWRQQGGIAADCQSREAHWLFLEILIGRGLCVENNGSRLIAKVVIQPNADNKVSHELIAGKCIHAVCGIGLRSQVATSRGWQRRSAETGSTPGGQIALHDHRGRSG